MRINSKWIVDDKLLWGYFFIDKSKNKLEKLAEGLAHEGYIIVRVALTNDKRTYLSLGEKMEHHNPQTMNDRNSKFNKLAEKYEIESYDGMDVGPLK